MVSLELAQEAQELGDMPQVVLITPVQSNEGVEHHKLGLDAFQHRAQTATVALFVKPKSPRGDEVQGKSFELEPLVLGDACHTVAYRTRVILCRKNHDGSRLGDCEST